MRPRLRPPLLFLSLLPALATAQNTQCASGVHMIVARASTEAAGTGTIGGVAKQVQAKIPGSDIVAVDYPATLQNYQQSEQKGVDEMRKMLVSYITQCPNSKVVMMGYSQGAQVTADVLCGTSEAGFTPSDPLPAAMTANVVAVVLMGDPSHVATASFNKGTSKKDGRFPRKNLDGCTPVAPKIVSYCETSDEFCDSGNSLAVHLEYVARVGTQATDFVVKMAGGGGAGAGAGAAGTGTKVAGARGTRKGAREFRA